MNEKHKKHSKTSKLIDKKSERRKRSPSSSSGSESDEWVEKVPKNIPKFNAADRDDWMTMGTIRTYKKEDIKPKRDEKDKKHIDSYNPSTSSRELNPYWKDGGTGVPQTAESFRNSRKFLKPADDDDLYSKPSRSHQSEERRENKSSMFQRPTDDDDYYKSSSSARNNKNEIQSFKKSGNWRKESNEDKERQKASYDTDSRTSDPYNNKKEKSKQDDFKIESKSQKNSKPEGEYLSDEKMNKLAAKIVKAEIMGDTKQVEELKAKLEAAREYRKHNPNAREDEDEGIMLIATNSAGQSRPLTKSVGDPRSKGGKRKAETHDAGHRTKYFSSDDKYDLAEMFQKEKYGNNYADEAQLAHVMGKHKNPNDDLEDIFMDEISKNRNPARDGENEKQRAIEQHKKIEKSLDGCEYCFDSKNMLKHLIVSYGNKVYVAVPAKKSLVKNQCIITTIQHSTCVTGLDEDVWEEIMDYRKALTQFYNSQNQDVVFYETATRLHKFPHMVINCIPMPRDVGDTAPIYFKKALLECEAEWSMNKKVVDLKGKNIRRGVPKGLPYFWIDFGMEPGFAHVIEDQLLFPKTFAEEIIGGILDLDHPSWKKPAKEYGDVQRKKVVDFIKQWKPFDPASKK